MGGEAPITDGHPLMHWAAVRETSLDNLALLCRYRDPLVHAEAQRPVLFALSRTLRR